MIEITDFETFVRRSLSAALLVADALGDELVNTSPLLTRGNTPYALITHMLGAGEWWVGHIVLGESSDRRREDEFTASGSVDDLHDAVGQWLESLQSRRPRLALQPKLAFEPSPQVPLDGNWTVGAALLHVYEEIAQHLGHLEVTADIVRAEARESQRS